MEVDYKIIESDVPFAESCIWKINRSYYHEAGISAWSKGEVPHNMTSSAFVGKTYAALILGILKDLVAKGKCNEKVYLVELGAGHGRLAYHILKQLDSMIASEQIQIPKYCYVLTDIVESNLDFFNEHPQFQEYISQGKLDISYFDGANSTNLALRNLDKVLSKGSTNQPIIVIANYFFDSIPNDLYYVKDGQMSFCHLSLESNLDVESSSSKKMIESLKTSIQHHPINNNNSQSRLIEKLLEEYKSTLNDTYLLIPRVGIECLESLRQISNNGLILLSMDKGYPDIEDLQNQIIPEFIRHGSFSIYVNFHAFGKYCDFYFGKSLFSSFSNFSLQLGCLFFVEDKDCYKETEAAYNHYVNDFGPDDFNCLKKMIFRNRNDLSLRELITTLRLGYYDSTLFLHLLPQIKLHIKKITHDELKRLIQTLHKIGDNYFYLNEKVETFYEIGGILYDLGLYQEALQFFNSAIKTSGELPDLYYNKALCYYQLRMDDEFSGILIDAKKSFPLYEKFSHLDELDLKAV